MIKGMDKALGPGRMGTNMKVIGKTTKDMDKALIVLRIAKNMWAFLKKICPH